RGCADETGSAAGLGPWSIWAGWWPRRLALADPASRHGSLRHDCPAKGLQIFVDADRAALVHGGPQSHPTIQNDRDVGSVGEVRRDAPGEGGPFSGDDVEESRLGLQLLHRPRR